MTSTARPAPLAALLYAHADLLPTELYADILRRMADELRSRARVDAANYLTRAANALEG